MLRIKIVIVIETLVNLEAYNKQLYQMVLYSTSIFFFSIPTYFNNGSLQVITRAIFFLLGILSQLEYSIIIKSIMSCGMEIHEVNYM